MFLKKLQSIGMNMMVTLLMSAMFLLIAGSVSLINWRSAYSNIDMYIQHQQEILASQLLVIIKNGYANGEPLEEIIDSIETLTYVNGIFACLKDRFGRVIFDTVSKMDSSHHKEICGSMSIIIDGERFGTLSIASRNMDGDLHPFNSMLVESIKKDFATSAFIVFGLSLFFAVIIGRSISDSLLKLEKQADSVKYDKNTDITVNSSIKEINCIRDSLNHMLYMFREEEKWRQSLLDDLAHELRTPLTVISTQLEAMADGVVECSEERLNHIYQEVSRLIRLVVGMQELSLAEGSKFELKYEKHDICVLVKKVVNSFLHVCKDRNITLKYSYIYEPCIILCDGDKIIQAVFNIISNAVKYSYDNSTIEVDIQLVNDYVHIRVKDHGVGIPEDCVPKLFTRFYRVDSSRSIKTEGNGLGLCIAKSLVNAHKGEITVDTKYHQGSTFTLVLPRAI